MSFRSEGTETGRSGSMVVARSRTLLQRRPPKTLMGQKLGHPYANLRHLMPSGAISYVVKKALQPLLFEGCRAFFINTRA